MPIQWEYISSKSNSLAVRLAKLKDKKYRRAEELFKFDGIKLFCEAAQKGAPIKYVLLSEEQKDKNISLVENAILQNRLNARLYILADEVFAKLTDESSPEGIITVCAYLDNVSITNDCAEISQDVKRGTTLILESVRDAGNMGTVIRSAKAFGIDTLILSSDCADVYNPKTVRGAMGALFAQDIIITDWIPNVVSELKNAGLRVFAAALQKDARVLGTFDLKLGDAIIVGNEGHGLSKETVDACDECLYIPMESGSESLNAGVAASVCMWELYKTKQK